jgi:LysR family transcriptional regulator (chromosome initiation inhibitor)
MLDYKLVEAFAAVIEERGFERAAVRLGLTQSAVAQRVRQLEAGLGRILVVRESPPRPTLAGERLLRHYRQVAGLEAETVSEVGADGGGGSEGGRGREGFQHIPIAVNTDSLAVWLLDAVGPFLARNPVTIEILVDEQDRTLDFLKSGVASGCISPQGASIQGCVSTRIGSMRYLLVASPAFAARWFPGGFDREAASRAPIVHSDREDMLQHRALVQVFRPRPPSPPAHYVPTAEKYLAFVEAGLGYGLVSDLQALPAIRSGRLVEVSEAARVEVPLYWHRWEHHSALFRELTEVLVLEGGRLLGNAGRG